MPRAVRAVDIFIASPSDVSDERTLLENVTDNWNAQHGRDKGLHFELLRWESVLPGVGDYPQDVINREIGENYDVFVGIMWHRFGKPTHKAESGTEEEFDRAITRHMNGDEIDILLYFKSSPVAPGEIDTEQLGKVQKFKKRAETQGVLHQTFGSDDDLRNLFSLHLTKLAKKWGGWSPDEHGGHVSNPIRTTPTKTPTSDQEMEGELGLFDYEERLEDSTERLTAFMEELAENIERLGSTTAEEAEALTTSSGEERIDRKRAATAALRVANALEECTNFVDNRGEEVSGDLDALVEAVKGIIEVSTDFEILPEEMETFIQSFRNLFKSMTYSASEMDQLMETVASLPRLTSKFNKARENFNTKFGRYTDKLKSTALILNEATAMLEN